MSKNRPGPEPPGLKKNNNNPPARQNHVEDMPAAPPAQPYLISWNLTGQCNLECGHCYIDAGEEGSGDELPTEAARRVIDEIAALCPEGPMLVMTGGEPLLRADIFELIEYASSKGIMPTLGTNATKIDDALALRLKKSGIAGLGISIDSSSAKGHDRFRGVEGAWQKSIKGAKAVRRAGLPFQIQFTITKENAGEIEEAALLARELGAVGINYFFLVRTGRERNDPPSAGRLNAEEHEYILRQIVRLEALYGKDVMVRARCAPLIDRIAREESPSGSLTRGGCGCIAATGYLRIDPGGFVTPCPYIPPAKDTPNITALPLKKIWEEDSGFIALRARAYKNNCGKCELKDNCGGCRARALAETGDLLETDPLCLYEPEEEVTEATSQAPQWSAEAEARLQNIPVFLRTMVRKSIERYATVNRIELITPALMAELKKKAVK